MTVKLTLISILLMLSAAICAQDYSTWGEIYDYEVGDVFHRKEYLIYDGWTPWIKLTVLTVTDVEYSVGHDTVNYQFWNERAYIEYPDSSWTFSFFSSSAIYVNLNSFFIADTVYHSPDYHGRKISFIEDYATFQYIKWRKYVDGCGQVNYFLEHIDPTPWKPSWQEIKELVYYKKGLEEWGTPNPVVGLDDLKKKENSIVLFPNPTRDVIHLSGNEEIEIREVLIYDQMGQIVYTTKDPETIDISSLDAGLYLVGIITQRGRVYRKLIKE